MVSVKLLLFFVAVAVTVVVPSAGTLDLLTDRLDTLAIVVNFFVVDVVRVPGASVVSYLPDTVTVLEPSVLCVTVLDFVARSCLDVDFENGAENEYFVPSIVMEPSLS